MASYPEEKRAVQKRQKEVQELWEQVKVNNFIFLGSILFTNSISLGYFSEQSCRSKIPPRTGCRATAFPERSQELGNVAY